MNGDGADPPRMWQPKTCGDLTQGRYYSYDIWDSEEIPWTKDSIGEFIYSANIEHAIICCGKGKLHEICTALQYEYDAAKADDVHTKFCEASGTKNHTTADCEDPQEKARLREVTCGQTAQENSDPYTFDALAKTCCGGDTTISTLSAGAEFDLSTKSDGAEFDSGTFRLKLYADKNCTTGLSVDNHPTPFKNEDGIHVGIIEI